LLAGRCATIAQQTLQPEASREAHNLILGKAVLAPADATYDRASGAQGQLASRSHPRSS